MHNMYTIWHQSTVCVLKCKQHHNTNIMHTDFKSVLAPHALTPADPTWNPCTEMRTVSPTLARVGDMKSLGPFGAAGKIQRKKKGGRGFAENKRTKGHCREREEQILSDTCFVTGRGGGKYNFLSIKVMGREAGDLRVLSSRGLRRIYSPLERKGTKLGRYSLREENWSAAGGV